MNTLTHTHTYTNTQRERAGEGGLQEKGLIRPEKNAILSNKHKNFQANFPPVFF